ncbi:MAG: hypothetical protein WBF84_03020 [Castellaniella sp.]|uniref:hypothetical protein n=1 Tax=Castellaniella sp. TaxID=1955812 RepID=UPI003C719756
MEDALAYLKGTAPASEGLFKLLNQYGWHKMRTFVAMTKSSTRIELDAHNDSFSSINIAREVVAGSILQIAYVAISRYSEPQGKSESAIHFESEINRLIRDYPELKPRTKKFELPLQFCLGRHIGDLPLGIVIYAGRNQYNHFHEGKRLSVLNEVVFNHLHTMWPDPPNELSFDLKPGHFFSYSILAALGWVDTFRGLGYEAYKRDMGELLRVDL